MEGRKKAGEEALPFLVACLLAAVLSWPLFLVVGCGWSLWSFWVFGVRPF
jgi:hypothetical protein